MVPSSSARRAAVTPTVNPASAGTAGGAESEEVVVVTGFVTLVRSAAAAGCLWWVPTACHGQPEVPGARHGGDHTMVAAVGDRIGSAVFPWRVRAQTRA